MPEDTETIDNEDSGLDGSNPPTWTIAHASGEGSDLDNCNIVEVGPSHYKFTEPDLGKTLSESSVSPPLFQDFEYLDKKWTLTADSPLVPDFDAHGRWGELTTAKEGDWTAQAGVGPIGERAASADA